MKCWIDADSELTGEPTEVLHVSGSRLLQWWLTKKTMVVVRLDSRLTEFGLLSQKKKR